MSVGSDDITTAPLLTLGTTSGPTPSASLTVEDYWDASYGFTRTAWWRIQLPDDWDPDSVLRVDCLQTVLPDGAPLTGVGAVDPFFILTNGTDFTAGDFNWQRFRGVNGASRSDLLFDINLYDFDPGQIAWIGMALYDGSPDVEYLLRVGKLVETLVSTDPAQGEPVTVWRDIHAGSDKLHWGTGTAPGVQKFLPYGEAGVEGFAPICNYEPGDSNYLGIVTNAAWTYTVASFDPAFCAQRPLPSDAPGTIYHGVVTGTGVDQGEDYDYFGTGDKYPSGRQQYHIGEVAKPYAFYASRKDYAAPGQAGYGYDSIFFNGAWRAGVKGWYDLTLPSQPDPATFSYLSTQFEIGQQDTPYGVAGWANAYLPEDPERGGTADVVRPDGSTLVFGADGMILSRRLVVALRTSLDTTYVEGGDSVLIGLWSDDQTGGKTFADVVNNMTLVAALPAPPIPTDIDATAAQDPSIHRDYTVYSIELTPDFELNNFNTITAVVSPSIDQEVTELPVAVGLVEEPGSITPTWGWWNTPQAAAGDTTITSQGIGVTVLAGVEYTWQPPTYHFEQIERSTELEVFTPSYIAPMLTGDLLGVDARFN